MSGILFPTTVGGAWEPELGEYTSMAFFGLFPPVEGLSAHPAMTALRMTLTVHHDIERAEFIDRVYGRICSKEFGAALEKMIFDGL